MSTEEEKTQQKRNLKIMIIVAIMFAIGILIRWDYTKQAVREGVMNYFGQADTITESKK